MNSFPKGQDVEVISLKMVIIMGVGKLRLVPYLCRDQTAIWVNLELFR